MTIAAVALTVVHQLSSNGKERRQTAAVPVTGRRTHMAKTTDTRQAVNPTNKADAKEITARYRAYCDACERDQLDKVPSFWELPALFTVDTGEPETLNQVLATPAEMVALYGTLFGSSTGVDKTLIDSSEVTFYGDRLATIKTELRHLAGEKLHDRQYAVYGCRKVNDDWFFVSHLSSDITG
jgi:hypothetical protein